MSKTKHTGPNQCSICGRSLFGEEFSALSNFEITPAGTEPTSGIFFPYCSQCTGKVLNLVTRLIKKRVRDSKHPNRGRGRANLKANIKAIPGLFKKPVLPDTIIVCSVCGTKHPKRDGWLIGPYGFYYCSQKCSTMEPRVMITDARVTGLRFRELYIPSENTIEGRLTGVVSDAGERSDRDQHHEGKSVEPDDASKLSS